MDTNVYPIKDSLNILSLFIESMHTALNKNYYHFEKLYIDQMSTCIHGIKKIYLSETMKLHKHDKDAVIEKYMVTDANGVKRHKDSLNTLLRLSIVYPHFKTYYDDICTIINNIQKKINSGVSFGNVDNINKAIKKITVKCNNLHKGINEQILIANTILDIIYNEFNNISMIKSNISYCNSSHHTNML
uniref:Uncharacterized protein n=1 Tax=Melicertus latisulcatus majanivirus TaxID=2984277 RepID=A0A9C7F7X0_9VIRU|nr:MAG: hypothetical protein [Melicertus latisulcatus majanivirus]